MESIFLYKGRNGCVDQGILWLPTVLKQQQLLQLISSNNCENRKDRKLLFTGAQNRLKHHFLSEWWRRKTMTNLFDLGDSETFLEDYVTTLDVGRNVRLMNLELLNLFFLVRTTHAANSIEQTILHFWAFVTTHVHELSQRRGAVTFPCQWGEPSCRTAFSFGPFGFPQTLVNYLFHAVINALTSQTLESFKGGSVFFFFFSILF